MDRRQFLKIAAVTSVAGLSSGCTGGRSGVLDTPVDSSSPTQTASPSPTTSSVTTTTNDNSSGQCDHVNLESDTHPRSLLPDLQGWNTNAEPEQVYSVVALSPDEKAEEYYVNPDGYMYHAFAGRWDTPEEADDLQWYANHAKHNQNSEKSHPFNSNGEEVTDVLVEFYAARVINGRFGLGVLGPNKQIVISLLYSSRISNNNCTEKQLIEPIET